MKKRLLTLAGGALLALSALSSVVGCSKKDSGLKVVFWHTFGDKAETSLQAKATEFEKLVKENEGVELTVELQHLGGYTDVARIVGTGLVSGTGPTMTVSYPDSVAYLMSLEATDGQYVVKMDDYFNNAEYGFGKDKYLGDTRAGTSDFITSYLREGQSFQKDGTYVLPYMKSSEIMLYNLEAVTKVMSIYRPDIIGSAVKEFIDSMSWDDLIGLAQCAVDNKAALQLTGMTYPIFYDSDSNMLITQLEQLGMDYSYLDNDKKPVLALDKTADPENYAEAVELLTEYRNWHVGDGSYDTEGHYYTTGLITTKKTEGTYASDSFKNMKCLFTIGSSGGAGYSFPQTGAFTCGVARVPYRGTDSETPKYISQGPSIAFLNDKSLSSEQNAQRLKYGWKFYKYITNTKNNIELCVNGSEGYIPVRNSCYADELWAAFIEEGGNYADAALVLRDVVGDNFISSLVFNGSATYRDEMTSLVGGVMRNSDDIGGLIDTAIINTKNAMK